MHSFIATILPLILVTLCRVLNDVMVVYIATIYYICCSVLSILSSFHINVCIYILGKCPWGPKSRVMFKHPWINSYLGHYSTCNCAFDLALFMILAVACLEGYASVLMYVRVWYLMWGLGRQHTIEPTIPHPFSNWVRASLQLHFYLYILKAQPQAFHLL